MKIVYGSDFHYEFYKSKIIYNNFINSWNFDNDTDLIIIAGDLHVGADNVIETIEYIEDQHNIRVLYIPGNHDYYYSSFNEENKKFQVNETCDIFVRSWIEIEDVTFIGCPGNIDGSYEDIYLYKHGALNDFRMISDFNDHKEIGIKDYEFMKYLMSESPGKKVAITHTMPSPKCISQKYQGSVLNACFCNDWEDLIEGFKLEYWICGHTHDEIDMVIDETRVLCNPYGYPHENLGWRWEYFEI